MRIGIPVPVPVLILAHCNGELLLELLLPLEGLGLVLRIQRTNLTHELGVHVLRLLLPLRYDSLQLLNPESQLVSLQHQILLQALRLIHLCLKSFDLQPSVIVTRGVGGKSRVELLGQRRDSSSVICVIRQGLVQLLRQTGSVVHGRFAGLLQLRLQIRTAAQGLGELRVQHPCPADSLLDQAVLLVAPLLRLLDLSREGLDL
mmetsp:Transcript_7883/g.14263  ORF Transcript_7883/g.14263 Transcript_7883/m.14263 type:complete len:203 (+) Transcript_7883:260-868(+)